MSDGQPPKWLIGEKAPRTLGYERSDNGESEVRYVGEYVDRHGSVGLWASAALLLMKGECVCGWWLPKAASTVELVRCIGVERRGKVIPLAAVGDETEREVELNYLN